MSDKAPRKVQRWKHISVAKYEHDSDTGWCESADVKILEDEVDRLQGLEVAVGEFLNATGEAKKEKLAALIAAHDEATERTEAS